MARRPAGAARGIAPELLISQVRSTAPYLFEGEIPPRLATVEPVTVVRELDRAMPDELTHAEYFRLCLSAHYLTCATPVPTDVDNQIRKKLWAPGMPLATALEMSEVVLASRSWDFGALSARTTPGARGTEWERAPISGHHGEWFTVASGAYAALGAYRAAEAKARREALLSAIAEETEHHAEVFGSLWRAKDGIGALLASATIAHNFGDLDRVIEMWDVPIADPLRLRFHKLTASAFDSERKLRYGGRLWTAGQLYKSEIDGSSMALENHRHFALRKPRAIRARPELRIPLGPFFDDWGTTVATALTGDDLDETLEALLAGSERMPLTFSYPRALAAIAEEHPPLASRTKTFPKPLRTKLATPRATFEARWNDAALALLDEIPSRA